MRQNLVYYLSNNILSELKILDIIYASKIWTDLRSNHKLLIKPSNPFKSQFMSVIKLQSIQFQLGLNKCDISEYGCDFT